MIHVIGESHAEEYRNYPYFRVYIVPLATAHNLIEEKSTSESSQKIKQILKGIPEKDYIMFVLGEIDCRVHIYQIYEKEGETKPLETYIENTVNRYITYIKTLNRNVILQTVPPAGYYDPNTYPFYGSAKDRAYINKTFNELLSKRCESENIPCVDIYDKVALPNGMANPEYLKDHVHLNLKATNLIVKRLREMCCIE